MDWIDIVTWFITAFVGAGIVKLFDVAASRYSERRERTNEKVNVLLGHIKEFGELAQLYRFFAYVSTSLVKDDKGNLKRDSKGNLLTQRKILEPEPQFEEAIKALKGTDINAAIAQKIAAIRLSSAEALDIAQELDPSGSLQKGFDNLYIKTVWSIGIILDNKNTKKPGDAFRDIIKALKEADSVRQELRANVQRYQNR